MINLFLTGIATIAMIVGIIAHQPVEALCIVVYTGAMRIAFAIEDRK